MIKLELLDNKDKLKTNKILFYLLKSIDTAYDYKFKKLLKLVIDKTNNYSLVLLNKLITSDLKKKYFADEIKTEKLKIESELVTEKVNIIKNGGIW